jgi:hypothetical protein
MNPTIRLYGTEGGPEPPSIPALFNDLERAQFEYDLDSVTLIMDTPEPDS